MDVRSSEARVAQQLRFEKAKELIAGGAPMYEALSKAHMSRPVYVRMIKENGGAPMPTSKRKTPTAHKFVDLAPQITSDGVNSVAIIVCKPEQIKQVIEGLK